MTKTMTAIERARHDFHKRRTQALIIMNETHSLLPEQEEILKEEFEGFSILSVPAEGWNLEEMDSIIEEISSKKYLNKEKYWLDVVFLSPIPYMLRELTRREKTVLHEYGEYTHISVRIFHNDKREKKELPDGRVIQVVAKTGWQLV